MAQTGHFWNIELPAAIREAMCSGRADARRIVFRSMSFYRPRNGTANDVLSWIACVERELALEGR